MIFVNISFHRSLLGTGVSLPLVDYLVGCFKDFSSTLSSQLKDKQATMPQDRARRLKDEQDEWEARTDCGLKGKGKGKDGGKNKGKDVGKDKDKREGKGKDDGKNKGKDVGKDKDGGKNKGKDVGKVTSTCTYAL